MLKRKKKLSMERNQLLDKAEENMKQRCGGGGNKDF